MAKSSNKWALSAGWKKQPVTFFQALGLPTAKIHWPKLEPGFSQTLAQQSKQQSAGTGTNPPSGPAPKQAGGLQNYAKTLLMHYGWGSQYSSFNAIEMAEAGWSASARNPTSGALGLAQALGHGNANTAGTLGNEYGGYGLTDAEAKQANSGNGYWQLVWMANYIKETYGSPNAAWSFHKAHGWY